MPRLRGQTQRKKKCVKATAFPCGFTCLPRMAKSGKEVRCRHKLHGQADTATKWLKQLEERMSAVNQKRAVKGRSSLFIDPKGSLRQGQSTINPSGLSDKELVKSFLAEKKNGQSKTLLAALGKEINRRRAKQEPAPSSPNPSGLSDRQLVKAFLKEKENRKSSVLLAALGKEIDRRNAKQSATKKDFRKPEFPAEQQKLLNLLTANLAHATKEEAKWIQQDIDDIKTLYPGIEPQAIAPPPKSSFRKKNARTKPSKPILKNTKPSSKPKDLKSVNKALEKEADDALNCLLS